jgi:hypothetical protein
MAEVAWNRMELPNKEPSKKKEYLRASQISATSRGDS